MEVAMQVAPTSKGMLWTGRVLSGLMVLFFLLDSIPKILRADFAVQGTVLLGYPASTVSWIGIAALIATILYAVPRTAIIGAILLTAHLGGATATQVRIESAWFIFPVFLGVLVWLGLYLQYGRLRSVILAPR